MADKHLLTPFVETTHSLMKREDELELLISYIFDELNDIPDVEGLSGPNMEMVQRILKAIERTQ